MRVTKLLPVYRLSMTIIARNKARDLFQSDLRFITYANQIFFILQNCHLHLNDLTNHKYVGFSLLFQLKCGSLVFKTLPSV